MSSPPDFQRSIEIANRCKESKDRLSMELVQKKTYDDQVANLVDYSIAYHALWGLMGYEFAFSYLGLCLRELIQGRTDLGSESWYGAPAEGEKCPDPGEVVSTNGVLGVVMPDIAPMRKNRVLFLGDLFGQIPDGVLEVGGKANPLRLIRRVDASNLVELPKAAGHFHMGLHGLDYRTNFPKIAGKPE
jgi:hypothetical protein